MGISDYENIEIFNKTQSFDINKCENQIIRESACANEKIKFKSSILKEKAFSVN